MKSNVTSTVQSTVKQEIRCFSEVLKSVPEKSALCVKRLKTVVRSAISEDDKSRNVIIHGLKEENYEQLSEKVSSLCYWRSWEGSNLTSMLVALENYQTGESIIFELINS